VGNTFYGPESANQGAIRLRMVLGELIHDYYCDVA